MKRSKIFLGVSAAFLAAVGIAATKVQSATNSIQYRDGSGNCVAGLVTVGCAGDAGAFCKQIVYTATFGNVKISNTTNYQLYTLNTVCQTKIQTQVN